MTFMAASLFAMRVEEARAMRRDLSSAARHRDGILGLEPPENGAGTQHSYLVGRCEGALEEIGAPPND